MCTPSAVDAEAATLDRLRITEELRERQLTIVIVSLYDLYQARCRIDAVPILSDADMDDLASDIVLPAKKQQQQQQQHVASTTQPPCKCRTCGEMFVEKGSRPSIAPPPPPPPPPAEPSPEEMARHAADETNSSFVRIVYTCGLFACEHSSVLKEDDICVCMKQRCVVVIGGRGNERKCTRMTNANEKTSEFVNIPITKEMREIRARMTSVIITTPETDDGSAETIGAVLAMEHKALRRAQSRWYNASSRKRKDSIARDIRRGCTMDRDRLFTLVDKNMPCCVCASATPLSTAKFICEVCSYPICLFCMGSIFSKRGGMPPGIPTASPHVNKGIKFWAQLNDLYTNRFGSSNAAMKHLGGVGLSRTLDPSKKHIKSSAIEALVPVFLALKERARLAEASSSS